MTRRILFWCHLVVACLFGLFIAFMAATGCVLTFQRAAFAFAERGIRVEPPPGARTLPIETLVRVGTEAEGEAPPSITVSSNRNMPAVFKTGRFDVLYIDPYSGALMGHGAVGVRHFFESVEGLHRWFGTWGKLRSLARSAKAAMNLGLLFLLLSGLVLWLPKAFTKRHLRPIIWPRRGLAGRAKNWNWHNAAGIWFALPLLAIVLTGAILSYTWANNLLFRATGNIPPPPDHEFRPAGAERVLRGPTPWEPLLARAKTQVPDWRTVRLELPDDPKIPLADRIVEFKIDRGDGAHENLEGRLLLQQRTGAVVLWKPFQAENLGQRLRYLARWTHTGESLGIAGQAIAFFAALGALLLVWTGFSLALHRLQSWRGRRARRSVAAIASANGGSMKKAATAATLAAIAACVAPQSQQLRAQDRNALDVQKARNEHVQSRRNLVSYPPAAFDLSALPHYIPGGPVSGTIRMTGSNYIADSHIGQYWEAGFKKFHPDVKFVYDLKSPSAAIPALFLGMSDLGPSRRMTFEDLLAYERMTDTDPIEIVYATGSYDVPGWSPAFGIFVNKDNPLAKLTMAQLEGIFGAERTGAWQGTTWHPERARTASQNIRTWGQLGLAGKWEDMPIHVYGVNLRYHQAVRFEDEVLEGSSKWNPALLEYANYSTPDGKLAIGAQLMLQDLSKDPYGIAYSEVTFQTPDVKPLAIAAKDGSPYIPITLKTVQDRTYPLHDQVYMYLNPPAAGKLLDPALREYMLYILSQEGQGEIARDAKYTPLTLEMVNEGRKKLENR